MDKEVIVGIRAEDIYPVCEGTALPEIELAEMEATIKAVDVLGSDKKLHLSIGDATIDALVRTYAPVQIGDSVLLKIAVNQIHLFDSETQLAIVH